MGPRRPPLPNRAFHALREGPHVVAPGFALTADFADTPSDGHALWKRPGPVAGFDRLPVCAQPDAAPMGGLHIFGTRKIAHTSAPRSQIPAAAASQPK